LELPTTTKGPDQDFPDVLLIILETLSQQSADNGYYLVAADLRALTRRAETYFRAAKSKVKDASIVRLADHQKLKAS
jgi:hypothetical protein